MRSKYKQLLKDYEELSKKSLELSQDYIDLSNKLAESNVKNCSLSQEIDDLKEVLSFVSGAFESRAGKESQSTFELRSISEIDNYSIGSEELLKSQKYMIARDIVEKLIENDLIDFDLVSDEATGRTLYQGIIKIVR